jgi:hypothetical protein
MTADETTPRLVRWTALGLFVLLPILAVGAIGINILHIGQTETVIERQQELLGQLDVRLARLTGAERTVADTSAIYIDASSAPLAGAVLQQRLVTAAETAGGRVIETQAIEEIEPDDEDDVRLRITLDIGNEGLRSLMHNLETGLPLMTLETVAVRQLPSQADEGGEDPILRVDLRVRGYWRAAT